VSCNERPFMSVGVILSQVIWSPFSTRELIDLSSERKTSSWSQTDHRQHSDSNNSGHAERSSECIQNRSSVNLNECKNFMVTVFFHCFCSSNNLSFFCNSMTILETNRECFLVLCSPKLFFLFFCVKKFPS